MGGDSGNSTPCRHVIYTGDAREERREIHAMKLTKTAKALLIGVAALALVAVVYAAVDATAPTAGVHSENTALGTTDNCSACPFAGTDQCPAAAADKAQATDKPYVDTDRCIGCGKCVKVAPDAFAIDRKTSKAYVKGGAPCASVAKGAKACPVGAVQQ